jgi:hypothetical protein
MQLKELQNSRACLSKSNIKVALVVIVIEMYLLLITYTLMVWCF